MLQATRCYRDPRSVTPQVLPGPPPLTMRPMKPRKVGVAPGTTTVLLPHPTITDLRGGGLGLIPPLPDANYWTTARSGGAKGLGGGLGLIPPLPQANYWTTARSGGARGLGIVPEVPEIQRQLSGLGVVPSDADLAKIYGYTPVDHGWICNPQDGGSFGQTTEELEKDIRLNRWATLAAIGAAVTGAAVSLATLMIMLKGRE